MSPTRKKWHFGLNHGDTWIIHDGTRKITACSSKFYCSQLITKDYLDATTVFLNIQVKFLNFVVLWPAAVQCIWLAPPTFYRAVNRGDNHRTSR